MRDPVPGRRPLRHPADPRQATGPPALARANHDLPRGRGAGAIARGGRPGRSGPEPGADHRRGD